MIVNKTFLFFSAKSATRPISQITQSALYDYLSDKNETKQTASATVTPQESDRHSTHSPTNSTSSHSSTTVESSGATPQSQNTASNFLKSIVKTIMEKKGATEDEEGSSKAVSEVATSNPGMYYSISSGCHIPSGGQERSGAQPIRADVSSTGSSLPRPKRKRTLNQEDEEWTHTLDEKEVEKLQESMAKTGTSSSSPYKTRSTQAVYKSRARIQQMLQDEECVDNEADEYQRMYVQQIKLEPKDYEDYQTTSDHGINDQTVEYACGNQTRKQRTSETTPKVYPTKMFQKDSVSAVSPHVTALLNKGKPVQVQNQGPINSNHVPYHHDTHITSTYSVNKWDTRDTSIQCSLLTDKMCVKCSYPNSSNSPLPVCSQSEDANTGKTNCEHCGINFNDEVLCSIHMGCHSHVDPFICNVCGRSCGNKYRFYTHIMRGHR